MPSVITEKTIDKYSDLFIKKNETTFADFSDGNIKQNVKNIRKGNLEKKIFVKVNSKDIEETLLKLKIDKLIGLQTSQMKCSNMRLA